MNEDILQQAGLRYHCPLKPLYDHVVVLQDKPDEKIGQIVVAEDAKKPKNTGTILAVGEGRLCLDGVGYWGLAGDPPKHPSCHVEPMRVKVGDRVMFSVHAGNEVEYENPDKTKTKVLVMGEDEIIAILPPLQT